MSSLEKYLEEQRIAYFSMEVGLSDDIHTYSGGLGVLAGDTLRASVDLNIPMVAITLVSRKGYFRQELTQDGRQLEHPQEWNPSELMEALPTEVQVKIQNRNVKIRPWFHKIESITGGELPILFLDTDVEDNTEEDREITSFLYG
ncbi:alpha-glucan family phosphorylase, partial [Candidatus Bathyarchaeota archaeon]|nr:glycosyltransferase family 1 protein [Desulfobacterales bacterium]NIU81217.1 alpha-glucan family phosphorylase [Candidatus Bathyarchaeota archaeon]NIW34462.1 alpha-glucan family phosphorylase [Candidatus Bathyarchaeota archaeon]